MNKTWLLIALVFPVFAFSQHKPVDSADYYRKQVMKMWKDKWEEAKKTPEYQAWREYSVRKNNYEGMSLFFAASGSDYGAFNKSLQASGLTTLNSTSYGLGFGSCFKGNHFIGHMSISATFNSARTADVTVGSSLFNFLTMDFGYDVFNSHTVSLYPYVGFGFRLASVSYADKGTFNSNYTSIADIYTNKTLYSASSFRVGYQAGLGFDVMLSNNPQKDRIIALFANGGINRPFWKDKYKISDFSYDPDITKGVWTAAVGFKFARRN